MSLLNFQRARGLATRTVANIATRNVVAIYVNPNSSVALGMSTVHQRGSLSSEGKRGIHQHASMVSSTFVCASRRAMHKKSLVEPSQPTSDYHPSCTNHARRSFSFYNDPSGDSSGQQPNMGAPAYTVYGEEFAFTLKAIPPDFRALPSGTVILDASKRGRLLLEWTPMASGHDDDNSSYGSGKRFRWDASTRFALTAEEAGSLLAKLDRGDPSVELSRRVSGDQMGQQNLEKVFIAKKIELEGGENDGISLLVDYVDPDKHQLGQVPHPQPPSGGPGGGTFDDEGLKGPFEIRLMVGEYQVLRSIIEYSIPKLVGWSTMFDRNIEQAVAKSVKGGGNQRGGYGGSSPHNYQGGGSS